MNQVFNRINPRGSTWQRWDPHIHAPGTALNDGFRGEDPWAAFIEKVDKSDPPIRALGITDYCGIDCYIEAKARQRAGDFKGVGLIFPNVEFRLSIETTKGPGVNLHLLFSPDDEDHVEHINAFLTGLTFRHGGETFRCVRPDLIRLGRAIDSSIIDDNAAYRRGVTGFKVSLEALQDQFFTRGWLRENCLVAVAGGGSDGTSGLQGDGGQWEATRKNIERFADIMFTANPKQIAFYLGKGAATIEDLETKWSGKKPCLHGSDAHTADRVGLPDAARRCWLNGDVTFGTLFQAVIEPEGRVHIGEEPPKGALPGNTIKEVHVSNAQWMVPSSLPVNAGMVAIIGARGSGKTALADFMATGGCGVSNRLSPNSFLRRASKYLTATRAELLWENGETTGNDIANVENEDLWDAPHVQYLSQQFVEQLCSSEGLDHSLVDEIQRVIFEAHPEDVRINAANFSELLISRMQAARGSRDRHRHALKRATEAINAELVRKAGLPKLEKDRNEVLAALAKDRADRNQLVPKGQETRAKRLEDISAAVEIKQRAIAEAQARAQALAGLQSDVSTFREQDAADWIADAQERRGDSDLSVEEWKKFRLNFTGDVDALLKMRIAAAQAEITVLQGPSIASGVGASAPPTDMVLIPEGALLPSQSLSLLIRERDRLQTLAGIDAQNSRRYRALTDKITRAETALAKLNLDIERAKKAEGMLVELRTDRLAAYKGIFTAVIDEETELMRLYAPLGDRIAQGPSAVKKLSFSVRRQVDLKAWAEQGEQLLDLRKGSLRNGDLLKEAEAYLGDVWRNGTAEDAAEAMRLFVSNFSQIFRQQQVSNLPPLQWARDFSQWLYSTDHIQVGYGLRYEEVDIERLSPGTRGIVLLLLYLALDAHDERPLIIDQPEENLDPQSVFEELVPAFCEAKKRRQVIVVTHNANLVVNTDVDQVIVARCGQHQPDGLPSITYQSGGLENREIREAVCSILEGGARAFQERARRLRVKLA
ncbi:TrlF family AAA-like ATPase [Variovorax sp. LT1R16]|uniref:TrlF family AAA-like ATPase n=1 Tax=Variovorax sp. LT1R16 TaxID=3443728 RepID=UPI003F4884F2